MSAADFVPDRGDVLMMHLTPQSGHEQAGHRPVLVISPASYNRIRGMAIICPITNQKKGWPFEVEIPAGLDVTGVILADQIKSLDLKSRGATRRTRLDDELVLQVVEKVLPLIDPDALFGAADPDG